ncbi:hypothetical protein ACIA5G_51225 [Amycolatopsis sp. NPDC051758]|uniref:hypothetical protein n=1 Tax=Amycolatopsis sp. NPDC051758 TaxID=3363935 RepID=UPI0037ABC0C4
MILGLLREVAAAFLDHQHRMARPGNWVVDDPETVAVEDDQRGGPPRADAQRRGDGERVPFADRVHRLRAAFLSGWCADGPWPQRAGRGPKGGQGNAGWPIRV